MNRVLLSLVALAGIAGLFAARAQVASEKDGNLLLRDFSPKTRLEVKQTPIARGRFPVIDVHFHLTGEADPLQVAATMDKLNVQMVVNLGDGRLFGDALKRYATKWVKPFPSRFAVMANLDAATINDADFAPKAIARLKEDVRNGAIGLKIYKDLGLVWRDRNNRLIPPDDSRFDPVWEACAEMGVPVLIHVNDTMPFFDPVDRYNERYLSLTRDQRSSWYGKVDATHAQLMAKFENIVARHPRTTFIAAHLGMHYEHLHTAARWLDIYPNLYYDLGASFKHVGRQPYTARRFLVKYEDRVLFGCDIGTVPAAEVYQYMFRVLETDDEYFEHVEPNAGLPWRVYGLFLPDRTLEKIYRLNAPKVYPKLLRP